MIDRWALGNARSDYGLYVSQPGYSVLSCDPSNLLFDSTSNFGQVFVRGYLFWPAGTGGAQAVYYSDIGFAPYPMCVLQLNGTGAYGSNLIQGADIVCTSSYFYINMEGTTMFDTKITFCLLKVPG